MIARRGHFRMLLSKKQSIMFAEDICSANVAHVYIFIYRVLLRNNQKHQPLQLQTRLEMGGGGDSGSPL